MHFLSHGRADETVFECEYCNRTGLPVHTQDLRWDTFEAGLISGSRTLTSWRPEWVWRLEYLTVCGEASVGRLACLQDLGSRHLTLCRLVLDRAPPGHVILVIRVYSSKTHDKMIKNMSECYDESVMMLFTSTTFPVFSWSCSKLASPLLRFLMVPGSAQ